VQFFIFCSDCESRRLFVNAKHALNRFGQKLINGRNMFKLFLHCSVESRQRIGFLRRTSSTREIHSAIVYISTMNLSSLNVDVLLYLMKFVKPVDRFNLVLSGILKGFENANEGINLRERYSEFLF
jgi:hypothetical protein